MTADEEKHHYYAGATSRALFRHSAVLRGMMGLPVVVVAVGPDIGMMADSSGGGFVRRSGEAFWVFGDFEEVDIRYYAIWRFRFRLRCGAEWCAQRGRRRLMRRAERGRYDVGIVP